VSRKSLSGMSWRVRSRLGIARQAPAARIGTWVRHLETRLPTGCGLVFEEKKFSVTIYYRQVANKCWARRVIERTVGGCTPRKWPGWNQTVTLLPRGGSTKESPYSTPNGCPLRFVDSEGQLCVKMPLTMRDRAPRAPTSKVALTLACGLTIGLWFFAGYQFTRRMAEVEGQAAAITGRYSTAHHVLSAVTEKSWLNPGTSVTRYWTRVRPPWRSAVGAFGKPMIRSMVP
jgi:hypothetical protein